MRDFTSRKARLWSSTAGTPLVAPVAHASSRRSRAILHDERVYSDPDKFDPGRFLTTDGQLDSSAPEPVAVFGFGRRACPGSAVAQDTLWIAAASLLWAFEMEHAKDAAGREVEIPAGYTFGVVR